jgi:hypothetical protein
VAAGVTAGGGAVCTGGAVWTGGAVCTGGVVGTGGVVAAGGTVGAIGMTAAGGTVGAVGTSARGGTVGAVGMTEACGGTVGAAGATATSLTGGTVALAGERVAGGLVTSGTESNESGQLETGSASGIVDGSSRPSLIVEDGGHAGIVCSVGGSGGQMSVSSGTAPCAGAASS